MAVLMWSIRCVGVCIGVVSLYTSHLAARMVHPDLRFVVGSSFGGVCVSL